jgi:hypothetical protein
MPENVAGDKQINWRLARFESWLSAFRRTAADERPIVPVSDRQPSPVDHADLLEPAEAAEGR